MPLGLPDLPAIPLPIPGQVAKQGAQAAAKQVSLLAFVRAHGFTGTTKEGEPADRTAGGIVLAESGGDPKVVNTGTACSPQGDHAVGLFQICCPMHMPVEDAKNAGKNADKAHQLYKANGNSFAGDWPTYHAGIYRSFKDKQITIGANDPITAAVDAAGNIVDGAVDAALGPLDELAASLLSSETWFRAGKVVLGGVLIIVGGGAIVAIALKPIAKVAAPAMKQAAKHTPGGAAAVRVAQRTTASG